MQELEGHGAGHWLDHGTEHPHRIALSVRADKVKHVVGQLTSGFRGQGIQVFFPLIRLLLLLLLG